jgi:hypothetical protein
MTNTAPQLDTEALARDLARWIALRSEGDPTETLIALCEVTAELLKLAEEPQRARANWLVGLDRFMAVPNRLFAAIEEKLQ